MVNCPDSVYDTPVGRAVNYSSEVIDVSATGLNISATSSAPGSSIVSITCAQPAHYYQGLSSVTCTATDNNGNQGTCDFTVNAFQCGNGYTVLHE
jgi:hypothetical protein